MLVFRKRCKSNVIVPPDQFKAGLTVWVSPDEGGPREQRVCTGNGTETITVEEHRKRREARAAENRQRHPASSFMIRRNGGHAFSLW